VRDVTVIGGSHAWTVGWQGDVAVVALVENSGSGDAAAPIAARSLTALVAA
jgi:hypothetical protein